MLPKLKRINYIPVGLGDEKFDSGWLTDKSGENISEKNKYYGEVLSIIGFGKMIKKLKIMIGLDFAPIEGFAQRYK